MAPKRSGTKASRSERRAERERLRRARERGLPERAPPRPAPPVDGDPGEALSQAPAAAAGPGKKTAGVPVLVKVVGVAAAILAGVYVLTHFRD